jgi:hypothetical protein
MDNEIREIFRKAEAKRAQQKREDRAVKFRNHPAVKELVAKAHRWITEIRAAVEQCGPLFDEAERHGLKNYSEPKTWLEGFDRAKGKPAAILQALSWIDQLTSQDFERNYSSGYPLEEQTGVFIADFLHNRDGNGDGTASMIRDYSGKLESWIRQNSKRLGVEEETPPPVMPPKRGERGHKVLLNNPEELP